MTAATTLVRMATLLFQGVILSSQADAEDVAKPLESGCSEPLRVGFFGDYYVGQDRFREDALAPILPLLKWADFNVVNLEGTVTSQGTRAFPDMPFALKMSPQAPRQLASAGIRYVTRGNNHSMDYGEAGMNDTSQALAKAGIHFVGIGKNVQEAMVPLVLKKGKNRLAIFSLVAVYPEAAWATAEKPGVAYPVLERLESTLTQAVGRNDFVLTVFHWGGELTTEIRDYQRALAEISIKKGVRMVVGHHAHMAQGVETLLGAPVFWGLGNFLFTSFGKGDSMSLGLSAEFCKSSDGPPAGTVRWALTPLLTGGKESMWAVRPMSLPLFKTMAPRYVREKAFPQDAPFFLMPEGKTRTLSEWLSAP